jgi:hypothetical protein
MASDGTGDIGKEKCAVLSLSVISYALAVISSAILVDKIIEMGCWSERGIVRWKW